MLGESEKTEARAVIQNVDAAVRENDTLHQRKHAVAIGHVDGARLATQSRCEELLNAWSELDDITTREDNRPTARSERLADGAANSGRASDHEADLRGEVFVRHHSFLLFHFCLSARAQT